MQVSLYEVEQCVEALRVSENRIEAVLRNILGGKYFRKSFVWSILSPNALWVWWKCHCRKKYEGIEYNVVHMIKILWDNLVHIVKREYYSIKGKVQNMRKKRRKIRKI